MKPNSMRTALKALLLSATAAMALVLTGCGEKAGGQATGVTSSQVKAFDTATPELKAAWQKAMDQDKKNDYLTAYLGYVELSRQTLSEEQFGIVSQQMMLLKDRMRELAQKGDKAALAALENLRANPTNQR